MFRANSTREELLTSGHKTHQLVAREAEDYFRERRWLWEDFRVSFSRHKKDMVVSWRLPHVPEVPTVTWEERASLVLGIRRSLDERVAMGIFAGVEGLNREPIALLKLQRAHRESLHQGLNRWDGLAWDVGELLLGLRHHKIDRKDLDQAILKVGRTEVRGKSLVPWARVGRLYKAYRVKGQTTSWRMLGEFQKTIWSRTPIRQMQQCAEFAKCLPVNTEWVSSPELLSRQGEIGDE